MIKFDRIIIGGITGAGISVALSQIAMFAGEAKLAGAAFSDPINWFMVAAISGACAGGGLTILLGKDN